MTYFQFHLIFNLPLLLLLTYLQRNHPPVLSEWLSLGIVFLAVGIFTCPWDNHAAKKGIWGFPSHQHSFKIKYLPIEEYLFFFIQSLLVILSLRALSIFDPSLKTNSETSLHPLQGFLILILLGGWIGFRKYWKSKPRSSRWNYTFHLFYWFTPILILQWILGYPLFLKTGAFLIFFSLAWGIYYTLCDLVATKQGIWFFDEKQIQGYKILNVLPWEETAFFIITSLLVAQSYLLLLPHSLR